MITLTICGSMRFSGQMQQIAWELETRYGFNILQCVYGKEELDQAAQERLKSAHYRKIELSDGIYVVDIGGYIGNSVRAEIDYTTSLDKLILYHGQFIKNSNFT